ncbi:hypothetical protein HAU87_08230 [Weissella confusa]|uniref:hypothetical protein n=1 Tax=Weissella confusa TaxID=1583 RepID=UPI0018F22297|nr:hypothetical protein [Weissella confusa]MBJ7678238.1 hypothetical protein [Weissella confusa]
MKENEIYKAHENKSSMRWVTQGAAILSTVLAASSPIMPIIQMAGSVLADDTNKSTSNLALTQALQDENSLASKYNLMATGKQVSATIGGQTANPADLAAAEFIFGENPAVTGISLVNGQLAVSIAEGTPTSTVLGVLNYIQASGYKAVITPSAVATHFTNNVAQNGSGLTRSLPLTTPINEVNLPAGLIDALLQSTTANGQTLAEVLKVSSPDDYNKVTIGSLKVITKLNLSGNTTLNEWIQKNIGFATYNPGQDTGAELRNFQNLFGVMTGITSLNMSGLMAGVKDMSVITAFMQAVNLPKLTKLTTLDLSDNSGSIDVNSLNISSSSLTTLNLANNNISGLGSNSLSHLPNLLNLNLADNKINYLTSGVQNVFYQLQSLNLDNNPLQDGQMSWLQKIMTDNPDFVLTMNGGHAAYQAEGGKEIAIVGQVGSAYVAKTAQSLQDEYLSMKPGVEAQLTKLANAGVTLSKSDNADDQKLAQKYATDIVALQQLWQMLPNMASLTDNVDNYSTIFQAKSAMDLVRDKLQTAMQTVTDDNQELANNEKQSVANSSAASSEADSSATQSELDATTKKGASIATELSSLQSGLDFGSYSSAISDILSVASSAAKAASSIAANDPSADYQADTAATTSALADRGTSSAASYLSNAESNMNLASSALSAGNSYAAAGNLSSANSLYDAADKLYSSAENLIKSAGTAQSTADAQLSNAASAAAVGSTMVSDADTISFVNSNAKTAQSSATVASSLVTSVKSLLNETGEINSSLAALLDSTAAASLASAVAKANEAVSIAQSYTDQTKSAADAVKSLASVTGNAGLSYLDTVLGNGTTLNTSSAASIARSQMTSATNGANSDTIAADSYFKQASSAVVVAESQASVAASMKSSIVNSILAAQSSASVAPAETPESSDADSTVAPSVAPAPVAPSDSETTGQSEAPTTSDNTASNESSASVAPVTPVTPSDSIAPSDTSETSPADTPEQSDGTVTPSEAPTEPSNSVATSDANEAPSTSDGETISAAPAESSAGETSNASSLTPEQNDGSRGTSSETSSQSQASNQGADSNEDASSVTSNVVSETSVSSDTPESADATTVVASEVIGQGAGSEAEVALVDSGTPSDSATSHEVNELSGMPVTTTTSLSDETQINSAGDNGASTPVAAGQSELETTATINDQDTDGRTVAGAQIQDMSSNDTETTSAAQKQVTGDNQSWLASLMPSIGAAVMGLFAVLFTRRRKQQEDATKPTTSDDQMFDEVEKLKSDWQEHKKK